MWNKFSIGLVALAVLGAGGRGLAQDKKESTVVDTGGAAPEKNLEIKGSIKAVKALLVRQLSSGETAGFAQPLTATSIKSGGGDPMVIKFNQKVGDDMTTALSSVVRGLQVHYGAWPHGYTVELGFEEKYNPKDGPSAAVACALLLDGLIHDYKYDTGFAVTGDLNSDLTVQPVGGVPAKIRGATARGAEIVSVPIANKRGLADLVVMGELRPFVDVAVFTAETYDQARDLALAERPAERPADLQQSLDEFATLKAGGLSNMRSEDSIAKLTAIYKRTPNFLSAELVLRAATRRLPKTLSLAGSFDAIDTGVAPFIDAIRSGRSKAIAGSKFSSTMEELRRVKPKLDPRVRPLHTSLVDLIVFDRRHVDKKFSNETQYRAAKQELKTLISRYDSEREKLRDNAEIIEELER